MNSISLRVLVVDDERYLRRTTLANLREGGFVAKAVENGTLALEELDRGDWDVVLTDMKMPEMDGLALLGHIQKRHPDVEVILMTGFGSIETAVVAMKAGAIDYLTKPFTWDELEVRLDRLSELRAMRAEVDQLRSVVGEHELEAKLIGRCAAMRFVRERIRLFADQAAPVLITGETGTGKEVAARGLHSLSTRSKAPFVAIASGAIPRDLAESELFGHERGSFTGAAHARKGSFERAHGGTVLLDDVDDLPLEIQVKLLRVLQEHRVQRVGGDREIPVDVRVIATTKVDLDEAVKEGRFRSDLFYRLRGLEIALPPLRNRGGDVLLLASFLLKQLSAKADREPPCLTVEAASLLKSYSWPGNVRELARVMELAFALCGEGEIEIRHLPEYLLGDSSSSPWFTLHLEGREEVPFREVVERFESDLVGWALRRVDGSQSRAAEILGLPRTTLQAKLARGSDKPSRS